MEKTSNKDIIKIAAWLIILQGVMLGVKQAVFCFTEETLYSRSMVTLATMIVLCAALILYCKRRNLAVSVFPKSFGAPYIIVTALVFAFYAATVFITKAFNVQAILMLLYGSVVTPVFEEILFRGVIWNKLNGVFSKELVTYIVVTLLFALWHIGYAVGIYLWTGGSLVSCIVMKVLVGGVYGVITGAIRYKTKNCYVGILVHGVLNSLG